ncbi:efflux RND transporter periplasmic adaptor subunit [Archangium primigenium]|uniref:efflux RND transporter periplasmic adaptor subunit n=1 Tax=[Archangium] primigenium TaxID=2792470 RepID=UPI00195C50A7|nr:efflux RND transporter periplasmic adaptor subunit [Archangium primigenium]MBM7116140.1 efflux RND transporter periplasmic adaptor subunit [Archangium primigenium]
MVLGVALAVGSGCGKSSGGEAAPAGKGGGGGGGGRARGPVEFPVEVEPVEARDVEYVVSAVGSVEAFEQVQITARVPGVVERVGFMEGQSVKKGQVLAEIEPARYGIAVRSAKAALERAEAVRVQAESAAQRRVAVNEVKPGLLPAEQLDSAQAQARGAVADTSAAKAALEQAELNQRDAYVKAPLDGVLQSRTVQTGQYVQPGTVLATLLRRDPMLVHFTVPESDVGRMKPGMTARFTVRSDGHTYQGRIAYVADAADPASRMVKVTAEVGKPESETLRPGAFATVSVPVETARQAPVIPQTAVRPSERGFLAYVVKDGKARERVVELGLRTADGLVEVRSGLLAGEQLVVRGGEALKEGAAVKVVPASTTPLTGEPRAQPVKQTQPQGAVR